MSRIRMSLLAFAVGVLPTFVLPSDAEAGPLLDWIRNRCKRNTTAQPVGYAQAAPNAFGLQPGQCMKTCQQTCARTVVNYVPYTAYRTEWKRVPVTQYRPETNTDPCTGCTVTCMRPCTTYSYQCQRVPYTTYRPEYRSETYQVPVTTITNDCATGTCGSVADCPTCVAPGTINPGNYYPSPTPNQGGTYYEYPATGAPRSGTIINPSGTTLVPADMSPSLNSQTSTRYESNSFRVEPGQTIYNGPTPAIQPNSGYVNGYTAESPARKEWNFSPTRLASYSAESTSPSTASTLADLVPVRRDSVRQADASQDNTRLIRTTSQRDDLNGWKVVK